MGWVCSPQALSQACNKPKSHRSANEILANTSLASYLSGKSRQSEHSCMAWRTLWTFASSQPTNSRRSLAGQAPALSRPPQILPELGNAGPPPKKLRASLPPDIRHVSFRKERQAMSLPLASTHVRPAARSDVCAARDLPKRCPS